LLDRLDRKRIMIASDVVRAVVALAFLLTIHQPRPWLLYLLSAALMSHPLSSPAGGPPFCRTSPAPTSCTPPIR